MSVADRASERREPEAPPVVRGLLTEYVAHKLEEELRSGVFAVGSRLPSERDLARRFNASRNVVREALRRLETRHLLVVEAGRGSFVTSPPHEHEETPAFPIERPTVRQLIEARLPLETETAALAARRASRQDIATLESAIERIARAESPVEAADADLAFHLRIATASGNPVLQAMMSAIGGMMFEMMLRSNSDPTIADHHTPDHPEILSAIRSRDAESAREAMRAHLEKGLRTYGADLDERLDVMARRHVDALLARIAVQQGAD